MLIIECPWCGKRHQTEFTYHGEAHIQRPSDPQKMSDEEWGDYVFFRKNIRGNHSERWVHASGCRRWFNVLRNTQTDHIIKSYRPDEMPSEEKK